jgi:hypothetical protein
MTNEVIFAICVLIKIFVSSSITLENGLNLKIIEKAPNNVICILEEAIKKLRDFDATLFLEISSAIGNLRANQFTKLPTKKVASKPQNYLFARSNVLCVLHHRGTKQALVQII